MENLLEEIRDILSVTAISLSFILGLLISYGICCAIDKPSSDNKKSKLSDYSALCFSDPSGISRTWFTIGTKYPINVDERIYDNQGVPWSVYIQGRKPKEGMIVQIGSYDFVLVKKEDI